MHYGYDSSDYQHPNGAAIDYAAAYQDALAKGGGAQPFVIRKLGEAAPGHPDYRVEQYAAEDIAGFAAAGFAVAGYWLIHAAATAADQAAACAAANTAKVKVWADVEAAGLDNVSWASLGAIAEEFMNSVDAVGGYGNGETFNNITPFPFGRQAWFADPSNLNPGLLRAVTQYGQGIPPGFTNAVDLDSIADDNVFATLFTAPVPTNNTAAPAPAPAAPKGVTELLPQLTENHGDTFHVKLLQTALGLNGLGVKVDGIFGPITLAAVRTFQGREGIAVDGIVGPVTWGKLLQA